MFLNSGKALCRNDVHLLDTQLSTPMTCRRSAPAPYRTHKKKPTITGRLHYIIELLDVDEVQVDHVSKFLNLFSRK